MATTNWKTGVNGSWTDPTAWDTGAVPGALDAAVIGVSGNYTITLTAAITVGSVSLSNSGATLALVNATGTTADLGAFSNAGAFDIDPSYGQGGSNVTVAGTLTNTNYIQLGDSGLAASDTLSVGGLANTGTIAIDGNTNAAQASLVVAVAAPTALTGTLNLYQNALVQFNGGSIGTIASGAQIDLNGGQSRIADAGNTGSDSALTGLTANAGTFNLHNGASVSLSGNLANTGNLRLDTSYGEGGSTLAIAGALTNSNFIQIGDSGLSASDTLNVASLDDTGGTINVLGNTNAAQASLIVAAAAPASLTGALNLYQNALVQFASGSIGTIASGGQIDLNDAQTRIADAGNTASNSALTGLTGNAGTFNLHNGASVSLSGNLANTGGLRLDTGYGEGGSTLAIAGALTNSNFIQIGDSGLSASDTLNVASLDDTGGTINVQGNTNAAQASLIVAAAAPLSLTGALNLYQNALVQFASGSIGTIASGGQIDLNDAQTRIADAGNTASNSALTGLTGNAGNFNLHNSSSVTLSGNLANTGGLRLDTGYGEGGSTLAVAGALTNSNFIQIGDSGLSASDTLSVASLDDTGGTINVQGNTNAAQASLIVAAAAPLSLTGALNLYQNALVQFASGSIGTIASGGQIDLNDAQTRIADAGNTASNSALTGLTGNAGTFNLHNGASVSLSGNLANTGGLRLDTGYGEGGSTLAIAGALTNTNFIQIGDSGLSESDTLSVASLDDTGGTINVQGNTNAAQASLIVAAAAPLSLTGALNLYQNALVQFASGSIGTIASGGQIDLNGAQTRIADAGNTASNSALTGLTGNAGNLNLHNSASVSLSGNLANTGGLRLDTSYGEGGSTLAIAGALTNTNFIQIGDSGLSESDTLSVAGLDDTGGTIDVQGNTNAAQASLIVAAAAPAALTGTLNLYQNALVQFASGSITAITSAGRIDLNGAQTRIADAGVTGSNSALSGLAANAGNFNLHNGATASLAGNLANSGGLRLDTGYGEGGASLTIGGTLTNANYTQVGNSGLSTSDTLAVAALVNTGTLIIAGSSTATATLSVTGAATNTGMLTIDGGGLLAASGGLSLTGGTLQMAGGTLDDTTLTLSKGATLSSTGAIAIAATAQAATPPGGGIVTASDDVTLAGGTLTAPSITVVSGARIIGVGNVQGALTVAGVADAHGGTLTLSGAVTGTGVLDIDPDAVLELSASDTAAIAFTGANGTLQLDAPSMGTGTISGFTLGDALDLKGTQATAASATYNAGTGLSTLTVTLSGGGTLSYTLAGNYAASTFNTVQVLGGDSYVELANPASGFNYVPIPVFPKTNNIQTGLIKEFPTGTFTTANSLSAPFQILPDDNGNNFNDSGTVVIPVSISHVTDVLTLLDAYAPTPGANLATVEFIGDQGADQIFTLVNGTDDRDFYQGYYANTIDNTTTQNAFTVSDVTDAGGTGNVTDGEFGTYVVDEQDFALLPAFAGQTLTEIKITGLGNGTPILLGLTAKVSAAAVAAPAQAQINTAGPVAFANVRVGTTENEALSISNTAATGAASLDAGPGTTPAGITEAGSITQLAAGATNMTGITVGIDTSSAGLKSGAAAINFISEDAQGNKASLPTQTIAVSGAVYRPAAASVTPVATIIHQGDTATATLAVANTDPADGYSENLVATITAVSPGITVGTGTATVAAGATGQLTLGVVTSQAGITGGIATVALTSSGTGIDGLGTISIGTVQVPVTVTVDNYAVATLQELSGGGTFTVNGANYTLNLGTVAHNSGPLVISLAALNSAMGPADLLSGYFAATGPSAFTLAGFAAFAGLGAGQSDTAPTVTLSTAADGTFTETITLNPTGSNAGGYSAALSPDTLTITGTVADIPPPVITAPATLSGIAAIPASLGTLTVSDPNTLTQPLSVTLTDATGQLTAHSSGLGTVAGSGSAKLILTGSVADVNAELASVMDTEPSVGADTVNVTVQDQYRATATTAIAISTTPVPNTGVVINTPLSEQTLVGTSNGLGGLSITDPADEAAGNIVSLSLTVPIGQVTFKGPPGAIVTGDNTQTVTFTGTVQQINADLADDAIFVEALAFPLIEFLIGQGMHQIHYAIINGTFDGSSTDADAVATIAGPEGKFFSFGVTFASFELNSLVSVATGGSGPTASQIATLKNDLAIIVADSHIVDPDGTIFDFNPVGEFVLAATTNSGDSFDVQVRLQPVGTGDAASVVTMAAVQLGNDRITFAIGRNSVVWLDGAPVTLTIGNPMQLAGGTLSQLSANTYDVVWNTGEVATIIDSGSFLNVEIAGGPNNAPSSIVGLLNLATASGSEFTLPDGTVLPQPITQAQFYQIYADTYRVPQQYSLLDYAPGQTTATFTDENFPESTFTLADLPASIVAQAAAVVAAAGITDPGVAASAEFDYIASGGDMDFVMADASLLSGETTTPAQVQAPEAGPVSIGVLPDVAKIVGDGTDPISVVYDVFLTGVATSDTIVNYTVVAAGAGFLDASAFGGTLPSGSITIPAGQTTGQITITVPAAALGLLPSAKLEIQISNPNGMGLLTSNAQEIVAQPIAGPPAVPVLTDLTNVGTFSQAGNNYLLDLGDVQYGEPLPDLRFSISNNGVSTADSLSGPITVASVDGFTVTGASLASALAGGQSYNGLDVTIDYSKFGQNAETITFNPQDTNNTGFATTLQPITLTIRDNIVAPTMVFSYAWGDVHIITYNQTTYNFQAAGEFTLAQSRTPGDSFDIQLRLQPLSPSALVTVITQAAISLGTDDVTFDVNYGVEVNGAPTLLGPTDTVLNLNGGTLTYISNGVYKAVWTTGEEATFTIYGSFINVSDGIPLSAPDTVGGLQGEDAGQASDFQLSDGTVLTQPLSYSQLYGQFADSWRVTQASSLFTYLPGQNTNTFTNRSFPPQPAPLSSLPTTLVTAAAAMATAAGISDPGIAADAEQDYLATGDASFIAAAAAVQAQDPATVPVTLTGVPTPPVLAGISAAAAGVAESATGTTPVTFNVYLTAALATNEVLNYGIVSPGAGYFTPAMFGGTLPSGQVTIAAGQTMASFTVNVPQSALGTLPSDTLEAQITANDGTALFATTAQTIVSNNQPEPGTPAVAALVDLTNPSLLTQTGPNAYTLNIGSPNQQEAVTPQQLEIMNAATAPADALSGKFTAPVGSGFIVTGTNLASAIAAGLGYSGIYVTAGVTTAGSHTETLTFLPQDINTSGYLAALPTITLTITDNVTTNANAGINTPSTILFPNVHVGGVDSQAISITNTAEAPAAALDVTTVSGGSATVSGSISGLAAGMTDASSITAGLATVQSGLRSGIVALIPVSDGGAGNMRTLATNPEVDLFGSVYQMASAAVTAPNLVVHVGDAGTAALSVANTATDTTYGEDLDATLASATGAFSVANAGPANGIAPTASNGTALTLSFSTAAAAVLAGTATVGLTSDGGTGAGSIDGLGQTALASQTVTPTVTVDNYAQAAFEDVSRPSALASGIINLGTIRQGAAPVVVGLGVLNAASGPSDALAGSFTVSGSSAFTNTGLTAFAGLTAGQDTRTPVVTLATGQTGQFSETITLAGTGSNSSGYTGAIAPTTVTIEGIVAAPAAGSVAGPTVSSPTLTVLENAAATPIGITASEDPSYATPLTATLGDLPTDGTVTLADGTAVTSGETLTALQLAGLQFIATPGVALASSTLGYTVTDPSGSVASGAATLAISAVVNPPFPPPTVSSPTVTVAANAAATPIGITSTEAAGFGTPLVATIVALPTDGTVTLANGTAVTAGETLTAVQLAGLAFLATPGVSGVSSTLSYSVTDPVGNVASGTATLGIGAGVSPPAAPTLTLTPPAGGPEAGKPASTKAISNDPTPPVAGSAVGGAQIAFISGGSAGSSTADANTGAYSAVLGATLAEGSSQITATATTSGGTSPASSPVSVYEIPAPVSGVSSPDISSLNVGHLFDAGYTLQFISGTESAALVDGTLSVGPDTNEAFLQRMYEGLFGRSNDASGMQYWDDMLAAGATKGSIAAGFMTTPEYKAALPASLTNNQLITQLYDGFLQRAPTAGDLTFWSGVATNYGQQFVVADIADSPEAKIDLAADTAQVWGRNTDGTIVHELYETGLGREVELPALAFWKNTLATALTPLQLAQTISSEPEFVALHGGQSNASYVASLYQSDFGRAPDAGGAQFWGGLLSAGTLTRAGVLLGIATSPEGVADQTRNL